MVYDGARDCGVVHDGTRVEVPTARQGEVPRQLRKLVRGARDCGVVHDGTRVVHVGARDFGARVVHEYTVHLDSTFLGVHLDSTF